ncbi:Ribonuclease HI [compost metagenome]
MYSWKKNGWIKSNKEKAKNIDLWEEILKYIDIHNIKFNKVKGHSTDELNNRCDELARNAIKNLT